MGFVFIAMAINLAALALTALRSTSSGGPSGDIAGLLILGFLGQILGLNGVLNLLDKRPKDAVEGGRSHTGGPTSPEARPGK